MSPFHLTTPYRTDEADYNAPAHALHIVRGAEATPKANCPDVPTALQLRLSPTVGRTGNVLTTGTAVLQSGHAPNISVALQLGHTNAPPVPTIPRTHHANVPPIATHHARYQYDNGIHQHQQVMEGAYGGACDYHQLTPQRDVRCPAQQAHQVSDLNTPHAYQYPEYDREYGHLKAVQLRKVMQNYQLPEVSVQSGGFPEHRQYRTLDAGTVIHSSPVSYYDSWGGGGGGGGGRVKGAKGIKPFALGGGGGSEWNSRRSGKLPTLKD